MKLSLTVLDFWIGQKFLNISLTFFLNLKKNSKFYWKFSFTDRALESHGKFRVLFGILHLKVFQILKNVNEIYKNFALDIYKKIWMI